MTANELKIYTDASYDRDSGFCGYSFLILKNQRIIHEFSGLAFANSSFNAELFALTSALEYLYNARKTNANKISVQIFVDCLSITQKKRVKPTGDLMFQYLEFLRTKFKASEITWVKGHSVNHFNKLVDKRARKMLREHIEAITYLKG